MDDFALILSLISLGFFGGFSHCIGMCGPFVLTQVSNNLQKTPIENYSEFSRLKNYALLPYQLGRITTYSVLGFFCCLFTKTLQDFTSFRIFSALFLFLAALFFLNLLFANFRLPFKSRVLESATHFFSKKISSKISFLFEDPRGFRGYFLGLILGFIPCGLLYGAFLIAASMHNPLMAAIVMFSFGLATFPALFLTALGGRFFLQKTAFKLAIKIVILINVIMLFLMSAKLIFN